MNDLYCNEHRPLATHIAQSLKQRVDEQYDSRRAFARKFADVTKMSTSAAGEYLSKLLQDGPTSISDAIERTRDRHLNTRLERLAAAYHLLDVAQGDTLVAEAQTLNKKFAYPLRDSWNESRLSVETLLRSYFARKTRLTRK